jgi:hypothetical protein
MSSTNHGVDLSFLKRSQLRQLIKDAEAEIAHREQDDRQAFEAKCRALAAEFGFDETAVRFAGASKRAARKTRSNGGDHA